jgi:hypothetical protein
MTLDMTESLTVSQIAKHLYDFLPASGNTMTSFPIAAKYAGVPEAWPDGRGQQVARQNARADVDTGEAA